MNLVSIVIITRNHAKYLEKCLNSILNQTYQNFEIVIVNHNSTDHTAQIIQSYKSEKIKYFFYDKNNGIAAARNYAVKKSSGEYIFFTDSDCIATRNWIEEGLKILIKDNVAGVEGKTIAESQNFGASQHFVENEFGGHYQTCNIAYKKQYLIECGMFNENYKIAYEDVELALRIKKISSIIFNSDMIIFHQLVKWSVKSLISNAFRAKDKVMLVKNHKEHQILNYKILEINSLLIVIFPFLLIFYYRIRNLNDLLILPFMYVRAVVHRIVVWKSALINKILIF